MGESHDTSRIDAVALARALDDAERSLRRGYGHAAVRILERATHRIEYPQPRRRVGLLIAAATVVASLVGGVALGSAHRSDSTPVAAISVAGRALRAADRINDPVALREIVTGVQDTISSLTSRAAADRRVAARLRDLAQQQNELLTRKADVPADLLERARSLVRAIEAVAPAPSASPAATPAASPAALP